MTVCNYTAAKEVAENNHYDKPYQSFHLAAEKDDG